MNEFYKISRHFISFLDVVVAVGSVALRYCYHFYLFFFVVVVPTITIYFIFFYVHLLHNCKKYPVSYVSILFNLFFYFNYLHCTGRRQLSALVTYNRIKCDSSDGWSPGASICSIFFFNLFNKHFQINVSAFSIFLYNFPWDILNDFFLFSFCCRLSIIICMYITSIAFISLLLK